ncbi:hypothetical protein QBC38DRAFT_511223 [Podospora fimiseda]|uniref:Polyketide synthase n=1 Tax=Podospora fimiseda TaxID=252190 RepID=A0AAN7GRG9_9PEZI|nr:hypothetical protein QBC38DRAFT_511223 [Podospora fimiseda]
MAYNPLSEPIAIVGMACRFAGDATNPSGLWDVLSDPKDLTKTVPKERFNIDAFYHKDGEYHGTTDSPKAYFLEQDHRVFDREFYNMNPVESASTDPQHRLLLEVVYEAMHSAGFGHRQYAGRPVGVFAGLMTGDYDTLSQRDELYTSQYYATGNARSILSNRVSYNYDFRGPSMTIDTACSSSLVALHQAVLSLRSGECEMACVAGANLMLTPEQFIVESSLHMLSPNGRSRHFDDGADGYARGEGVAAMFIRPLSQALSNGDRVIAIIRETGTNSDGRTQGITMPNWEAQSALIQETYTRAGLSAKNPQDRCQFFECHGTGTKAGDPREARAIEDAFFGPIPPKDEVEGEEAPKEPDLPNEERLMVGSVKTVIGHTEGAAGLAGLFKVVLSMLNNTVPPNLHLVKLNPDVEKFYRHIRALTTSEPWPEPPTGQPKRASVNSFGFGGSNAHAIIEEYTPHLHDAAARTFKGDITLPPPPVEFTESIPEDQQVCLPLLLSAQSKASLLDLALRYLDILQTNPPPSAKLVAWFASRSPVFSHRLVIARNTTESLAQVLEIIIATAQASSLKNLRIGVRTRTRPAGTDIKILGVFTGQGAQWATMTRGLLLSHGPFAETIRNLDGILAACPDPPNWTMEDEIKAEGDQSRVRVPAVSQPLCTAIQIALVDMLRSIGITFHTVVGHSSGEIGAAYAAGRITAREAILIAYYRGLSARLASSPRGQRGRMMAVTLGKEAAMAWCRKPEYLNAITVAASNSPKSSTLSGDEDMLQLMANHLGYEEINFTMLHVDAAYHSPQMNDPAVEYLPKIQACNIQPSDGNGTNWVSSLYDVEEDKIPDNTTLQGEYWRDNMVQPVLFYEAVKKAVAIHGKERLFDCAVEVGPHPVLRGPGLQTLVEKEVFPYIGVLNRNLDDREAFATFIGTMWAELGMDISLITRFLSTSSQPELANVTSKNFRIPPYQWDHSTPYWRESRLSKQYHFKTEKPHELLGVRARDDDKVQLRWRNILNADRLDWTTGHVFDGRALLPASGYLVMGLDAGRSIAGNRPVRLVELRDLVFSAGINLEPGEEGMESLFTVTIEREDIKENGEGKIEASMSLSAATAGSTEMKKSFSGKLTVVLGQPSADLLPGRPRERAETVAAKPDAFYQMMKDTGLDYGGPFQGLQTLQRRYNFASGTLKKYHKGDTTGLTVSPATLDSCLQTAFVTVSSPGDRAIWTSFLPLHIGCVRFNTAICDIKNPQEDQLVVDAYLTKATPTTKTVRASFTADIEIFNPSTRQQEIQIQGLTVGSWMKQDKDYELYLTTKLDVDPDDEIVTTSIEEIHQHSPIVAESCQRVASFYANAAAPEVGAVAKIGFGETPRLQIDRRAWHGQDENQLDQFMRRSPYFSTLDMIRRIGRDTPDALAGLLPTLVEEAHQLLGFQKHLGRVVEQIAHKYPQMNVLGLTDPELGLSQHILSGLGTSFMSFVVGGTPEPHLQERYPLSSPQGKKLTLQLLDLDTDDIEEPEEPYDLVVLTTSLLKDKQSEAVLRRIRSIMRQGGFLVLVHVSRNPLKERLKAIAAVKGENAGGNDSTTPITPPEWPDVLDHSGFLCSLKKGSHQYYPPGFSLIVRQADSLAKDMLHLSMQHILEPHLGNPHLQVTDHILLVGGTKTWTQQLCTRLADGMRIHCKTITAIGSLDQLSEELAIDATATIFLADLDEPATATMTEKRMDMFKALFRADMIFLWVTYNARFGDPDQAASFGFTRTMAAEAPGMILRIVDLDVMGDELSVKAAIDENFAQLLVYGLVQDMIHPEDEAQPPLWQFEREVHYENGHRLVPRVIPWKEGNRRVSAPRRLVPRDVDSTTNIVEIVASGSENIQYSTEVGKFEPISSAPGSPGWMRVEYSTVNSLNFGFGPRGYLCIGRNTESFALQVALCPSHASFVQLPSMCINTLTESEFMDQSLLLNLLFRYLFAIAVASTFQEKRLPVLDSRIAANMTKTQVVLIEPDAILHQCLSEVLGRKGVTYTLCTTNEARYIATPDLVFLHSGTSHREIKDLVPIEGAWVLNLLPKSDKLSTVLANSLPANCTYTHYSEWLGPINDEVDNILPVYTFWESALHLSLAKMASRTLAFDDEPALMSVPQLLDSKEPTVPPFQLVNWKADRSIPYITQPLACTRALKPNKTYVLVGITRDFGQSLCTLFVDQGARHIVLASRSPPATPPRWQREMQARGINVQFRALDVVDIDRVKAFKEDLENTMPPVGGVVNGAMILEDKVFAEMSVDTWRRVMGPKTIGSYNLHENFQDKEMDFFIMTSSFAAVGGHEGQSNYAAANMYMNGLAAYRRKEKLVGSALNIGVIYGLGFLHREKDNLYEGLEREGYPPISERDIHHMFVEAIMAGKPVDGQVYDITTGLSRFQHDAPDLEWQFDPRFSHFFKAGQDEEEDLGVNRKTLKLQLDGAQTLDELTKVVEVAFLRMMTLKLGLEENELDGGRTLDEFGGDSMTVVHVLKISRIYFNYMLDRKKPLAKLPLRDIYNEISTALWERKTNKSKAPKDHKKADADKKKKAAAATVIPSHQRILSGSAQLPPAPWPASATTPADQIDAAGIARKIISSINDALEKKDYSAIVELFRGDETEDDNCFWRDHLGLSWDLRTLKGKKSLRSFLESEGKNLKRGKGRGVVRVAQEGEEWKVWTVFTCLEELKGFEERLRARREDGVQHGGVLGRKNWRERREEDVEGVKPQVLVVGAGQGGLTIAARLKMLGVEVLIVDKNERVGDNWRKRYHQLVLHDPVWYDHMPYLPFPEFWPVFTPKDKLAEWFEGYAKALELNVWMESEVESSEWDEGKKEWIVTVRKGGANGEKRRLNPKHVVLCTGHSGKAYLPQIKGMDGFKGDVLCHSSAFAGAKETGKGKKAIVVGACNSSHDICQDFYEKGYEVTMVQRSSTCVVSSKAALKVLMAVLYEEGGPPVEDSDVWLYGWPSQILKTIQVDLVKIQQDMDKELLAGLEKAGFKTDDGIDKAGLFAKYLQRGGGYYIDVGMSQLIIDGKVKVKQGQEIVEVLPNGLKFADGTELEADEIVFATGYDSMKGTAQSIFGDKVADQTEEIWGWNEEGEMRGIWKGSGHPGFWYHAGNLALARYNSRLLALQIKGKLESLH